MLRNNLKNVVKKLKDNVCIKENSVDFMRFTIQDLLDYAQIKAGKFRKNVTKFDIRKTVEKVMSM